MVAKKKGSAHRGLVLLPGEGEAISVGENEFTYKLRSEESGGAFSVIEISVPPEFKAPPFLHATTKESWAAYILEGTLGFQLEERVVTAPSGSFIFFPKGLRFKWWNPQARPAKWLCIYCPAGFERMFEEMAEATKDLPPGPWDMSQVMPRLLPLWEKYGITRE